MPKCKDAEYCPLQKPVKAGTIVIMHVKKTRHLTKSCSIIVSKPFMYTLIINPPTHQK